MWKARGVLKRKARVMGQLQICMGVWLVVAGSGSVGRGVVIR